MEDIAKVQDIRWYADVPRSIRRHSAFGMILLVVTFGGFGAWAMTAPLAAAIVAQGRFVATGQNKIVQHFEGGIIKEILVNEGDQVSYGQPLIYLDETAARARDRELFLRRARLELIAARLIAQIRGYDDIKVPDAIAGAIDDPEIAPMLETQQLNFEVWKSKLRTETDMLHRNIEGLRFRADGYAKQQEATDLQLQLLKEELTGKQKLLKQGLMRATEIKAVQRAIAEATGQIARLASEVSETYSEISKQEQQIQRIQEDQRQALLAELEVTQGDLDSVREQSRQAQNVLTRATIDAPVSGTVVRMFYHTSGGVIESGKGILEILPADVPLVIEAQVRRTEIDSVRVGEPATIRLVALNMRKTPVLQGTVYYVSADALPASEVQSGQEFYLARVSIQPKELARVHGFTPTPGMPVEVLIQTAERTFFSYLAKPVVDSMSRAFVEE